MLFKSKLLIGVRIMVFKAIFNNISSISLWSILLVEETGVPEGRRIMLYRVHLAWAWFELTVLVVSPVIGTDCIDSYKSNYRTITATTTPKMANNIYLLTGYEWIASLLSPRHWLLTEAKSRSIVMVEGTTNLLFPNTQSISILLYRKTLDS